MIAALRHFLRGRSGKPLPAVPSGERVYAIGDIHGRLDLFDGGPDSAAVIDYALGWQSRRPVRIIAGNHEEMFQLALRKPNAFRAFLRIGGRETVLSYGIDRDAFHEAEIEEAHAMACAAVPRAHLDFLATFEDQIRIGDYLFVHAGINPGLPIDEQQTEDLRWIRDPFLTSIEDHGCVVVHGHTITEDAVVRPNRIGIDTGAFMSGRLTAVGLEGTTRWLIEAREDDEGAIVTSIAPLRALSTRGLRQPAPVAADPGGAEAGADAPGSL